MEGRPDEFEALIEVGTVAKRLWQRSVLFGDPFEEFDLIAPPLVPAQKGDQFPAASASASAFVLSTSDAAQRTACMKRRYLGSVQSRNASSLS